MLWSRRSDIRSRTNEKPRSTQVPTTSMTFSHDIPVASETDPSQMANNSSVAPRKLIELARPSPSSEPTTPPAVLGKLPPEKCSVARPQLLASARKNPSPRKEAERRSTGSRLPRSWNSR